MKKLILLVIMILIATFGITNNVNAEVCYTQFVNSVHTSMLNYSSTLNNGFNSVSKYLPNNETFNIGSEYTNLKGSLWYTITTNSQVISNINLETTCTDSHLENMVPDMIITYADGSHADIDGSTYEQICDSWQTRQVNKTLTLSSQSEITMVGLRLIKSDNSWFSCSVDSNGNFNCPIIGGGDYKGFTFLHTLSNNSTAQVKFGFLSGQFYKCINDTQSIINNQNQNSTSINNNITNLNDTINSDNVTGNNSNDSITSISNSFSSSNDFILNLFTLPYNFITTIMNGVSDSCTPISLGTIFNYELVMPCINLNNWLGNVWTNIVDVVLAGMLSFAFRKRIHDFFFAIIRLDRNAANIGGVEIL